MSARADTGVRPYNDFIVGLYSTNKNVDHKKYIDGVKNDNWMPFNK